MLNLLIVGNGFSGWTGSWWSAMGWCWASFWSTCDKSIADYVSPTYKRPCILSTTIIPYYTSHHLNKNYALRYIEFHRFPLTARLTCPAGHQHNRNSETSLAECPPPVTTQKHNFKIKGEILTRVTFSNMNRFHFFNVWKGQRVLLPNSLWRE